MKRLIRIVTAIIVIMSIVMAFAGCANIARKPPNKEKFDNSGYTTTFEDNFDGDSLDTKHWRIFTGDRHNDPHANRIHRAGYYTNTSDVLSVKDGNLVISTRYKESEAGTGWHTAWVETTTDEPKRGVEPMPSDYEGFSQKYGYFEVRCIAPPAEGMWSAFWLLPDEGNGLTSNDTQWTATDGCEVDIMESQNYFRKKDFVQHVVHSDYGVKGGLKSDKSPIYIVDDMYSTFHTYGVEWTPDKFIFYIDGYKTYETANIYDGKTLGTPKVKEAMILSVEIDGYLDNDGDVHVGKTRDGKESWLGSLDNMDKSKSYDFIIDYVKVMQKNEYII